MRALSHLLGHLPEASPRWLVTNGETTIGPVDTELLLRGYLDGRIPQSCQVRQEGWRSWRPLHGVRELGAVRRRLLPEHQTKPHDLRDAVCKLPHGRDLGELLSLSLQLAAQSLAANAGLVHRYRSPVWLPVTSSVFGVPAERLGEVLPSSDPAYSLALRGRSLAGSPYQGLAERLVAERLQQDVPMISIAMAPVIAAGRLVAMLELGRTDHSFRGEDADELAEFAAHVARRIG